MASTWKAIKSNEQFNKGRAALRGDYLQGSYNKSQLANVGPHYKHCAAIYEKAQARAERPLSERGYYEIAKVLRKRDKRKKQTAHFVKAAPKATATATPAPCRGVMAARRERQEKRYAAQAS